MSKSKKKDYVKERKCSYCSGKGQVFHFGGIEHGTYDTCPRCFGSGRS